MEQSASFLYWCNGRVRQLAKGRLRHQVGGRWTACVGGGPAWETSSSDRVGFGHHRRKQKFREFAPQVDPEVV